jgi:hypothetical protein
LRGDSRDEEDAIRAHRRIVMKAERECL